MKQVLIIAGDATETVDTLYPYYRLIEGGYQPAVAVPEKRRYQMVLHEVKPGWTITREWEGYTFEADIVFKDVRPEEYAGIFFSGGRAPEYLREDEDLLRITRHFFENNKPGCVRGRRMATVAKCKFDLEVCGGIYVNEPCVIDCNLVSGRIDHDNGHYFNAFNAAARRVVRALGLCGEGRGGFVERRFLPCSAYFMSLLAVWSSLSRRLLGSFVLGARR